jgi:hypothetical protein
MAAENNSPGDSHLCTVGDNLHQCAAHVAVVKKRLSEKGFFADFFFHFTITCAFPKKYRVSFHRAPNLDTPPVVAAERENKEQKQPKKIGKACGTASAAVPVRRTARLPDGANISVAA